MPRATPPPRCRWPSLALAAVLAAGLCTAQFAPRPRPEGGGRFIRIEGGLVVNEDELRTARETDSHSAETPNWTNPRGFEKDVFTFARVIFQSDPSPTPGGGRMRWLGWWVDYPDADLNFSYRLQQHTTLRTDPDARVLKLTDPALHRYPLLYMEHAGYMRLSDEEAAALRTYLRSGGALFVNDFWGAEEWDGFAAEIARVLPDRTWMDLNTDHPLFHCVYDLRGPMSRLQVPTIQFWNRDHDPRDPHSPLQTIYRGEGSEEMHVRALHDAAGRMLILAIHNSDISDGWERESENEEYFNRFSERAAYPLGINVIFYLMTH
jgi:hypothetical protein